MALKKTNDSLWIPLRAAGRRTRVVSRIAEYNSMRKRWSHQSFVGLILTGILLIGSNPAGAETRRYTYDDLGRLTRATYDTQTVLTYTYDMMDNRQTATCLACVLNGDFDSSAGWTVEGTGAVTFTDTLSITGATGGSANLTAARQANVPGGKTLTVTLLSYMSADPDAEDDYPVVLVDSTTYRIYTDGTLQMSAASCGAAVNNAQPVTMPVALTISFSAGPHTIGFGVQSATGDVDAGMVVVDRVNCLGETLAPAAYLLWTN